MRTEDLLEAIGEADDELLERSEKAIHKKNHSWKKWVPLAACACIAIGVGIIELGNGFIATKNDEAMGGIMVETEDVETSSDNEGKNDNPSAESIKENTTAKVNYGGTISPMTTLTENHQVNVKRDIVYDFTPSTFGKIEFKIEDSYTITNPTEEEIELQVLYPFEVGETEVKPVLADESGAELETVIYEEGLGSITESVLETYVTLQAGESITVKAIQYKAPDTYTESEEQFEYRLVTSLGDNLPSTETMITIVDSPFVEVEIQDFGFDLIEGNRTGKLEIGKDYYIQVKLLNNN